MIKFIQLGLFCCRLGLCWRIIYTSKIRIEPIFIGLIYGFHLETMASTMFLLSLLTLMVSMVLFADESGSRRGARCEVRDGSDIARTLADDRPRRAVRAEAFTVDVL